MELSAIKGIGPTRLESLRAVGVCSLRDLCIFFRSATRTEHTRFPARTQTAARCW